MKWLVTAALLLFLFELGVAHKLSADANSREIQPEIQHETQTTPALNK